MEMPTKVKNPNFNKLEKITSKYLNFLNSEDYCEDNDYTVCIFETALECLYGEKIWEFVNDKMG